MSETNREADLARWGRPLRKRSRGPQPQPAASDAPVVGPVDEPVPGGGGETLSGPRFETRAIESRPQRRSEPNEQDVKLQGLVAFMAKGLVDHPDDVHVEFLELASDETVLELHVNGDDLGHVIGKQGRTARSLRLALGAAAARAGHKANLE